MLLANFLEKNIWTLALAGGFVLGLFIGYQVLPQFMPRHDTPLDGAELQSALAAQQQLEAKLTAAVNALSGVDGAQVQLATPLSVRKRHRKATVTIPHGDALSPAQVATIAEQVASGVEGLAPGSVTVIDASAGATLNLAAVQDYEKQIFWTNIAINIAKILGIIAALVTVRFIIQAIGRSVLGEEAKGC